MTEKPETSPLSFSFWQKNEKNQVEREIFFNFFRKNFFPGKSAQNSGDFLRRFLDTHSVLC